MTKQEFEKRIGAEISQKDYSIVEHVYTWHPSISEVEGKKQIAELYKSFGMPIIKNMMEAANYAETLDRAMAKLAGLGLGQSNGLAGLGDPNRLGQVRAVVNIGDSDIVVHEVLTGSGDWEKRRA